MPTRSLALRAASLAGVAMLAMACNRSRSLDVDGLEAQLQRQYQDDFGARRLIVTCPDDVDVQAGATFTCEASQPNGATLVITVTQTDDQGTVRSKITGASD